MHALERRDAPKSASEWEVRSLAVHHAACIAQALTWLYSQLCYADTIHRYTEGVNLTISPRIEVPLAAEERKVHNRRSRACEFTVAQAMHAPTPVMYSKADFHEASSQVCQRLCRGGTTSLITITCPSAPLDGVYHRSIAHMWGRRPGLGALGPDSAGSRHIPAECI